MNGGQRPRHSAKIIKRYERHKNKSSYKTNIRNQLDLHFGLVRVALPKPREHGNAKTHSVNSILNVGVLSPEGVCITWLYRNTSGCVFQWSCVNHDAKGNHPHHTLANINPSRQVWVTAGRYISSRNWTAVTVQPRYNIKYVSNIY